MRSGTNARCALAACGLLASGLSSTVAGAEPVTLPAGTPVPLRLEHHVTSSYTPAGAPIHFSVAEDVRAGDRVVVRAGTPVQGKMFGATDRGMVGKAGSMSLGVRLVPAVDGSLVNVEADLAQQGRSRAGATVAWTVFWGLPGLITRGVNPYLERGTVLEATVLNDATVEVDAAAAPATATATPPAEAFELPLSVKASDLAGVWTRPYRVDIERSYKLRPISFSATPPVAPAEATALLQAVELVAVDGVPVPQRARPTAVTAGSFTFDAWPLVQYCGTGTARLKFAARAADGRVFASEYLLPVEIAKKPPKAKKDDPT